ncbi:MAG: hypothetical protein Q8O37_10355 [Sulfuricellaceae bacterium]|nr:hypothetical protein [Sulfuricellaceae bacterium]
MRKIARAVKRKYGMANRAVAVRPHVSWRWRGAVLTAALCIGLALAWWLFDMGGVFAGLDRGATEQELVSLRGKVNTLESENVALHAAMAKSNQHEQIDSVAQADLEQTLKNTQLENAKLKEELAFLQGMSSSEKPVGLSIHRFRVDKNPSGTYRYQLYLLQSGQSGVPFKGEFKLVVTGKSGARPSVLSFPADSSANNNFKFNFKSYQKLEGDISLPADYVVKSVEARIFGNDSGKPRLAKTINLSG